MKKLILTLAFIAILTGSQSAQAFETPVKEAKGKEILTKMGKDLTPLASKFGTPNFVYGDIKDHKTAQLVFTAAGEKPQTAKRLMSITIYSLDGKKTKDTADMYKIVDGLRKGYKKNAKVISNPMFLNAEQEPGMFIEYTMLEGAQKQHAAGSFKRISDRMAAFLLIQSTGSKLPKEDADKMKAFLGGDKPAKAVAGAPKVAVPKDSKLK